MCGATVWKQTERFSHTLTLKCSSTLTLICLQALKATESTKALLLEQLMHWI